MYVLQFVISITVSFAFSEYLSEEDDTICVGSIVFAAVIGNDLMF